MPRKKKLKGDLPPLIPPPPPPPDPVPTPCGDCDPCKDEASFGLLYCEDGVSRVMPAPTGTVTVVPVFTPGVGWTYASWPP